MKMQSYQQDGKTPQHDPHPLKQACTPAAAHSGRGADGTGVFPHAVLHTGVAQPEECLQRSRRFPRFPSPEGTGGSGRRRALGGLWGTEGAALSGLWNNGQPGPWRRSSPGPGHHFLARRPPPVLDPRRSHVGPGFQAALWAGGTLGMKDSGVLGAHPGGDMPSHPLPRLCPNCPQRWESPQSESQWWLKDVGGHREAALVLGWIQRACPFACSVQGTIFPPSVPCSVASPTVPGTDDLGRVPRLNDGSICLLLSQCSGARLLASAIVAAIRRWRECDFTCLCPGRQQPLCGPGVWGLPDPSPGSRTPESQRTGRSAAPSREPEISGPVGSGPSLCGLLTHCPSATGGVGEGCLLGQGHSLLLLPC